jgi:hypothetical protein
MEERAMAKGQKRSNREAKKPKQDKPKSAPAPSPFAQAKGSGQPAGRSETKR